MSQRELRRLALLRHDVQRRRGRVRAHPGRPVVAQEKSILDGKGRDLERFVAGGDVGSRKPRRDVFDRVLGLLDSPADAALMVGNNPETDVAGALHAGLRAVLVRRPGLPARPVPAAAARTPVVADLVPVARRLGVTAD